MRQEKNCKNCKQLKMIDKRIVGCASGFENKKIKANKGNTKQVVKHWKPLEPCNKP